MPELDGPRLEPRSGPARQLIVFLHGYGADGNDLIDIGRAWQGLLPHAAFVSPHAPEPCGQAPVGKAMVPAHLPRSQRALDRGQQGSAGARKLSGRRAQASQPAAFGARACRLQPGHHDGAACGAAARGGAVCHRRLLRAAGRAARCRSRQARGRDQVAAAGPAHPRRSGRAHPGAGAVPGIERARRARRAGRVALVRTASATASTRKDCATAASSSLGAHRRRQQVSADPGSIEIDPRRLIPAAGKPYETESR